MSTITIQDLQQNPRDLLNRVQAGEHLLIVDENRTVAEIHPVATACGEPRPFGLSAGTFTVPADFDAPLPELVLQAFEGR